MSNSKYSNGQAVLSSCVFCGATFEEAQKLGDKVSCPEEQGGCGNEYRISMYEKPAVKQEDN